MCSANWPWGPTVQLTVQLITYETEWESGGSRSSLVMDRQAGHPRVYLSLWGTVGLCRKPFLGPTGQSLVQHCQRNTKNYVNDRNVRKKNS